MVTGINYDESSKAEDLGYKSVYVHGGLGGDKVYDSGDFERDWFDMVKDVIHSPGDEHWAHSSTVDHFIMDGAKFDSAYLKTDDGEKFYLSYEYDPNNVGIEFFVKEGTRPTWEELKERYKTTE